MEFVSRLGRARASFLARLNQRSRPGSNTFIVLGAITASICAGALTVTIIGVSRVEALVVFFEGAVGSLRGLAVTLVFTTPRLFVALGAVVAVRCGVFNLGGEGQLQLGAIGAVLAGTMVGQIAAPLHIAFAILAAMAFGAVWAMLAILLKLWRGADEIIFLEEGRIIERGSHHELIARGGRYAALYALQTRDGGDEPAVSPTTGGGIP